MHIFETRLRLKLLAEWTDTLKKVGHRLICFLLLVFKSDYDEVKVKTMTSIDFEEKDQLKVKITTLSIIYYLILVNIKSFYL